MGRERFVGEWMYTLTEEKAKLIAKDIEEWASSKKGQRSLKKSLDKMRIENKKLRESLRVSPESMLERITI